MSQKSEDMAAGTTRTRVLEWNILLGFSRSPTRCIILSCRHHQHTEQS